VRSLVAEHGAVDAVLTAGIDKSPPNKKGISVSSAEDELLAWAGKQGAAAPVPIMMTGIVTLIEG